jgi:hypothetical protein
MRVISFIWMFGYRQMKGTWISNIDMKHTPLRTDKTHLAAEMAAMAPGIV